MSLSLGELGEQLVGKWLSQQDYKILHYRWRCRWGEIDLIARHQFQPMLIFVEVKTRGDRSWDSNGLEAISTSKQRKISRTAALFLAKNPKLADFNCRFDVALVHCRKSNIISRYDLAKSKSILKIADFPQGDILILENYLENAFEFYY